jgi:tetraacyldisaccharide 4'-kinase
MYGIITLIRNGWFDILWSRGKGKVKVKTIVVGNLSAGGTGKSPFVKFLWENDARIQALKPDEIAILSRGYGRKTKGFILVEESHSSADVGDEPLMLKFALPESIVAVCENRVQGIRRLCKLYPQLKMVVLDDAYQHRRLQADEYILLTTFDNLFTRDFFLPVGNLREWRTGAKRASKVVVTKSPQNLSPQEKDKIKNEIAAYTKAPVAFACLDYDELECVQGMGEIGDSPLLVTGIANPQPLVAYLLQKKIEPTHLKFKDHHHFTASDIDQIVEKMKRHSSLITTEKDWVRLKSRIPTPLLVFLQGVRHKMLD